MTDEPNAAAPAPSDFIRDIVAQYPSFPSPSNGKASYLTISRNRPRMLPGKRNQVRRNSTSITTYRRTSRSGIGVAQCVIQRCGQQGRDNRCRVINACMR